MLFLLQTVGQEISITANISGLPSNTVHGFHIHELGDTVTDGKLKQNLNSPHNIIQADA